MKVTLKLSAKQLGAIVFQFNKIKVEKKATREDLVSRSVVIKLIKKMYIKYLDVKDLPRHNRKGQIVKYTFSFSYHEAHFLEQTTLSILENAMSEYDYNVLNYFKDQLNEKLVSAI